ncbi:hypothetical protein KC726_05230 [Candidatus Woesebacteria bacterium]|nr:hypothetical protein [Candidatus Woesebacteria bacterium]
MWELNDYSHGSLQNQMSVLVRTTNDMTGELKRVRITALKKGMVVGALI